MIVDTLPPATPTTTFDVAGTSGISITESQYVGPQFTLNQPMVITEIGGFFGQPYSTQITVQVRPALNGVPHPSTVLGTYALSNHNDPDHVTYETATPDLTLAAGTYYALFAHTGYDDWLLANAYSPFEYHAPSIA